MVTGASTICTSFGIRLRRSQRVCLACDKSAALAAACSLKSPADYHPRELHWPRWPNGKVPPLGRRVPGSKPDSTEDPPCMGPVAL
ncbi:hypothetical protein AVEN_47470-1 [Araneus ventricosus]|uniref:Uncharacterized protein n=1 Tax=Araneus ventricosus TaxID=182803 RepID=A0A4Y2S5Y9_ARAVE|nr:hypothetical protein AVEN_243094-1 [Araneus ventricosus]GBN83305.1 hypothetical protein AVEN_47470-1 [Araneus ventricosus]